MRRYSKPSEDMLSRLFAERMRTDVAFAAWLVGKTRFAASPSKLLHEEQARKRPHVSADRWWRHWWCKIPHLGRERETDIFLVFGNDRQRFALHIENKNAAKFLSGQAEDYEPRAKWMMNQNEYLNYSDFQTLLLAPRSVSIRYPRERACFDVHVPYEALAEFIPEFSV